jgi:hypothetical protein
MRYAGAVTVVAVLLAGCAASKQEVAAQLGSQYVGQNVDALVRQFGPPASSFKLNSGETSYVWQLDAETDINVDRGSGIAKTYFCKVSVIASPAGIVSQLRTEEANAGAGLGAALGLYGSICAQRLGMRRQQT